MICDWCGRKYSETLQTKEVFHLLEGYALSPVICDECYSKLKKHHPLMTQKTTDEIRALLSSAKLDFASVENKALNGYLKKIFPGCPFTNDLCMRPQCLECEVYKKLNN
jgi:hypothetical protein